MGTNIVNVVLLIFINNMLISLSKVNAYVEDDGNARNHAFDQNIYKEALDEDLCEEQLLYITKNDSLLWRKFLEAGPRIPRSVLEGNTLDMGNYQQCLRINEQYKNSMIEGKYCSINFDLGQIVQETSKTIDFNRKKLHLENDTVKRLEELEAINSVTQILFRRAYVDSSSIVGGTGNIEFRLSVCIPKTCTTKQGIDALLFNITTRGLQYTDNFCRLINDKPWVPTDYVAIGIFSIIGVLTLMSTSYDLWSIFFLKTDPKEISTTFRSFSVYTNTRKLTKFAYDTDSLECVDGIRVLSTMWLILVHTLISLPSPLNSLDFLEWKISIRSMWISAGLLSVDSFFVLSGLLLVYTTAGKISSMKLMKNLHLFYFHRLLRLFPLLAAVILLQVSIFHHISDGPYWHNIAKDTTNCRKNWWINLLYLQNLFSNGGMCLDHTWYLAVDTQLHILSPLVLFWVLSGNKRFAWLALTVALFSVLMCATVYNFIMKFPGAIVAPDRMSEQSYYLRYYYVNTLTRASPFFVGMIFGYLLHLWKGKTVALFKASVVSLWISIIILISTVIFATEHLKDIIWDNLTVQSLINSFMRPAWALGLGLIIFLCVHGYGGPINWFLSLQIWKIPSRLSYGMYLFHVPIIYIINGSALVPNFFSVGSMINLFLIHFLLAFIVSLAVTLIVDSPFSTLFKLVLRGDLKKTQKEATSKKPLQENVQTTIGISNREVTSTEIDAEQHV